MSGAATYLPGFTAHFETTTLRVCVVVSHYYHYTVTLYVMGPRLATVPGDVVGPGLGDVPGGAVEAVEDPV